MSQQNHQPQQQNGSSKKKKNVRKKMNKNDQQNQKPDSFGAGDGDGEKQSQVPSNSQPNNSNLSLLAKNEANNRTNNIRETTIISMCVEHLRRQMQSLMCGELNQSPEMLTSGENSGHQRSSQQQRRTDTLPAPGNRDNSENNRPLSKSARLRKRRKAAQQNKYVAIDCEMVGVGYNGQDDMLARVSIVNRQGEVLLDKFVKPWIEVIDYRTSISGIRPEDIENGEDFHVVQNQVAELIQGKILVGHAIRSDLAVLYIKHPFKNIRDTARYKPLCRLVSNGRTPSLKLLSQTILGMEIQIGEHNSVEDARAAMKLYNRLSSDWEIYIQAQEKRKK
ncbi:uncharacterized protein LOC128860835 [Anastrepha ludens]|uniref:uncharacterized protein LOC128860835 n=1 Tax=Anastrepha ludens TaxID=28586 RepID=UPI0023AFEB3F|nr:uncharacterized protein LOC128860835 [Anastrepha ludens]